MDFSNYFYPENILAFRVITVIWVIAIAWIIGLVIHGLWLRNQKKQMQQCEDVRQLVVSLQEWAVDKEKGDNKANLLSIEKTRDVFRQFCKHRSLKEKALVPKHLKAIFEAGLEDGRLEVGELIKHTSNKLFQINGMLRSMLALFIVLGLLGTLFGLADSLAQLAPLSSGSIQQSKDIISQNLASLLSHLKSAFAPSILGISFTIFGVIIFSLYLNFVCAPVKHTLEHLTLTVWIPQLFPTTSQRLLETLALSEKQIHQNLASVQKVAELSSAFQNEAGDLQQSMKNANEFVQSITQASTQIKSFAENIIQGVGLLIPFQQELQKLYKQIAEGSEKFQQSVSENIKNTETFQKSAKEVFNEQNQQIKILLKGFQGYESAYIESRNKLDTEIHQVLESADKAFIGIETRNKEVTEALGVPLREELSKSLGEIKEGLHNSLEEVTETLKAELKGVQGGLAKFDAPITNAAEQISGSLETFDKRTETLTKELQREMLKQTEANSAQLNHLKDTNEQIAGLLQALSQSKQLFSSTSHDLGNLSQSFSAFGNSILELGKTLNISGNNFQQMQRLEESNKQIVAALNRLDSSGKSQSEQVQTLVRNVSVIEREVGSINKRVEKIGQSARSDGGYYRPTEPRQYQTKASIHEVQKEELSLGRRVLNRVLFWRSR